MGNCSHDFQPIYENVLIWAAILSALGEMGQKSAWRK